MIQCDLSYLSAINQAKLSGALCFSTSVSHLPSSITVYHRGQERAQLGGQEDLVLLSCFHP